MYSSVDTIWVLLGAALVFFMQAGFAMVETGLTRAKNAGNIIMKNLMDFALGTVAFLAGRLRHHVRGGRRVDRRVRPVHPGRLQQHVPVLGVRHFSNGVLRHGGHHRLRRDGGAHQVPFLIAFTA